MKLVSLLATILLLTGCAAERPIKVVHEMPGCVFVTDLYGHAELHCYDNQGHETNARDENPPPNLPPHTVPH